MSKKFFLLMLALGLALVAIAALLVFLLLKTKYPNLLPSPKKIVIQNQIPGFTFDFKDKASLMANLEKNGFWKPNTTIGYPNPNQKFTAQKLTIVFTDQELNNPFFIQNDTEGKMIISSEVQTTPEKGEVVILISMGDYLLHQEQKERLPLWARSRFWQSLSIVSKGISKDQTQEVFKLL